MEKRKRIVTILVLVLLISLSTTYAWLTFNISKRTTLDMTPSALVQLEVTEVPSTNTKQLVPSKYYWITSQTDEYRYYIKGTNLVATDPADVTAFYQEILNGYTISLSNDLDGKLGITSTATADGIFVVVFLIDSKFQNFGDYRSWKNSNSSISIEFVFKEITQET